ncbi:MAG: hypothetical protein K2P81_08350 [Bacteriovoracaceae bacterium]|nr:hypothetical protein [Bacteriovoracaceae bacterium]
MKFFYITLFSMLIMYGCAHHSTMRGTVAMKVSEHEAHVCLNKDEVRVGDRVVAFYNDCQSKNLGDSRGAGTPCIKTKLGHGTVAKILNEHYSLVKFDEGVKFSESTFVEK